MKTYFLLTAVSASCLTSSLTAATLVDWNMGVLTGTRNDWPTQNASLAGSGNNWSASWTGYTNPGYIMNSTTEATSASGTIIGNMLGTNSDAGTSNFAAGLGYVGGMPDGDLNLGGWATGAGVPANWLYFTMAPTVGNTLTLTGATVTGWRNGGGAPGIWSVDYSTNSGASWTAFGPTVTVTATGSGDNNAKTFTASGLPVFNSSDVVTLRFAPYGGGGSTGNIHITGLTVMGDIMAIPEPGTYGVLGAGVLAAVAMVRRRRRI